ncbi:hypothetical protein MKK70_25275 [Methylobacterium sp. E-041]|uniref:hypothetical protein n=1 Tax=Methylobacterium sp. E-041 TaxID=2836573 RepID=UPI001FB9D43F|nr:hypothetical protein [Methylobacterium sp. E-041]MCJ2108624.1 hypothetical protein [Methylobacterium sp. E-041]
MMLDAVANKNIPKASLVSLPLASEAVFTGYFPWSPISTTNLTKFLNVDRGNWGTWRNRGLTPEPLPASWFRRASGSPITYRIDSIRDWLARRTGERYDALADWADCLCTDFETSLTEASAIRTHAAMYARAAGPHVGDVTFTALGFESYVRSLAPGRA